MKIQKPCAVKKEVEFGNLERGGLPRALNVLGLALLNLSHCEICVESSTYYHRLKPRVELLATCCNLLAVGY